MLLFAADTLGARAQAVAIIGSVLLFFFVLELLRRRRLGEPYAILWLLASVVLLTLSIWNQLLAKVADAVGIPVVGGFGGGPWLDGRMRMVNAAIGYAASAIEGAPDTYVNVAKLTLEAMTAYAEDVRAARQLPGGIPVPPAS